MQTVTSVVSGAKQIIENGQQAFHSIQKVADGVFHLVAGDLSPVAIAELLEGKVTQLVIASEQVTDAGLECLRELKDVSVWIGNGTNQVTIDGLKSLSEMGNIKSWGATLTSINDASITGEALAALDLGRLEQLSLNGLETFTDADLNQILQKADLRILVVGEGPNLSSEGLALLPTQQNLKTLSILGVPDFTDEKMILASSLSNLKHIVLGDLPITNKAFEHLSDLNLELVILTGFPEEVTAEGLRPFFKAGREAPFIFPYNCPGINLVELNNLYAEHAETMRDAMQKAREAVA